MKCFGYEAFGRKTGAGWVSPSRSGGSVPGRGWSVAPSRGGRDPEGTSPQMRTALNAGTACTAARLAVGGVSVVVGGGIESPVGRQEAPASESCNNPESG